MKIKKNTIFFLFTFTCLYAIGQVNVKGKVYDEHNEPVIGANIIEKGTKIGKMSDLDGSFSISVTNSKATLIISYIGMKTITVQIASKSDIKIILESYTVELEDAVVIG